MAAPPRGRSGRRIPRPTCVPRRPTSSVPVRDGRMPGMVPDGTCGWRVPGRSAGCAPLDGRWILPFDRGSTGEGVVPARVRSRHGTRDVATAAIVAIALAVGLSVVSQPLLVSDGSAARFAPDEAAGMTADA